MARPISDKTKQKIAKSKYSKKTILQSVMYNLQEKELYEFVLKNGSGNFLKYLASRELERWKSVELGHDQGLLLDGYYEKTPWKIYEIGDAYEIELGIDRYNTACYGKRDIELDVNGDIVTATHEGNYWVISILCNRSVGWSVESLVAETYHAIEKLLELKRASK